MDIKEAQQQQQQQQQLHRVVIDGIVRLTNPYYREEKHKLIVNALFKPPVDRQSLDHLVNFLDDRGSHEVVITELELFHVHLDPSDGGLQVLRSFFARSDTTLTKVALKYCDVGSAEETSQLLSAFHPNRTITDLTIEGIRLLQGAAFGASLSSILQNMPQLQRLDCKYNNNLRVEGIRALQAALQANRILRELNFAGCRIGDEGIRLIADALVGNSTIEVLDINSNEITSNGLDDITRLLQSTRIKGIILGRNYGIFNDEASTQRFARILSRHEFLKALMLSFCSIGDGGIRLIVDALVENTTMQVLDIHQNLITSVGLADITRLLESTQLKTINFLGNLGVFNNTDATQHFVTTLQHKNSSVQKLPEIDQHDFPGDEDSRIATFGSINKSLKRNQQLNHVNLLLAPPPPPSPQQQQQNHHGAALMMFKTWHKAITKFAMVPNNVGASAIFKLFQARPQLLEKRLKRPATASASVSQEQKRQRL